MTAASVNPVHLTTTSLLSNELPTVLVGALAGDDGPTLLDPAELALPTLPLGALGVTGARDQLIRTVVGDRLLLIIGLGDTLTPEALRSAAGSAVRQLSGVTELTAVLPNSGEAELAAITEGLLLGGYRYDAFRGLTRSEREPISISVFSESPTALDTIARAGIIAQAVSRTKDLVNEPALSMTPERFADVAVASIAEQRLESTVWDEAALAAEGFGGIAGVGQGSTRGPRLLRVAYRPEGATRHIALVGKGITFDTGGLSLKPPVAMIGMKYDMTGAATVLAVVRAAEELALPVAVTAWMPLAENMPSGTAIRPGDVLTAKNGETIEVLNTDAEGRLVLADALVAASEEHPDAIIDVATLTGAAEVALGTRTVGLVGHGAIVRELAEAGLSQGELLWEMPITPELRPMLDSDIADIRNVKPGNSAGGMLLAAAFLRDFIGDRADGSGPIDWGHLDIAGPAANEGAAYGFTGAGATGTTVRSLIALLAGFIPAEASTK